MMSFDEIGTYFTVFLIEIKSTDLVIKMTMFFPEYIFLNTYQARPAQSCAGAATPAQATV